MSLRTKLTLSFLLVGLTAILLVAVLVGQATANEFGRYVFQQEGQALSTSLADLYEEEGDWASIREDTGGRRTSQMGHMPGHQGMMERGAFAVLDDRGHVVIPGAGFPRGQQVGPEVAASGIPIEVDGSQVGTLIHGPRMASFLPPAGEQFLARLNRVLILAGGGAVILALVLGVALSQRLTASLRELKDATSAVAQGELGRQVPVRTNDEVGELADSFNQMSIDLAEAASSRRQLTADIAHELRTPLSLIMGQSEALYDGVLPRSDENLRLIQEEAAQLNRIVEDLRILSLATTGELSLVPDSTDLGGLVRKSVAARSSPEREKHVRWELELEESQPPVNVDPDRIQQALGNILDNALHHSPPGGTVTVQLDSTETTVRIVVEDEGPGIDPQDLPHLFERFYRADRSRSRDQGGSGLGLSIAKSLIEAHGGRVFAENRAQGGARFTLELPK